MCNEWQLIAEETKVMSGRQQPETVEVDTFIWIFFA
jgi:hypothetical protein